MARLLLTGIAMIPGGIALFVMGARGDGVFPQGVWQGPIVIILGLVLIVMSLREIMRTNVEIAQVQNQPPNKAPIVDIDSNQPDFAQARSLYADAIRRTLEELIPRQFPDESVYVFALTTTDDCDHMLAFANSEENLNRQISDGSDERTIAIQRWYPGEWGEDVTSIAFSEAEAILESDEYDDESAESTAQFQARRLWVMTKALRDIADEGLFHRRSKPITVFCTMFDDENADWLERVSAELCNPTELATQFEVGRRTAAVNSVSEPGGLLERAFHELWNQESI